MNSDDLTKLDEASLMQIVEAPEKMMKWLPVLNFVAVALYFVFTIVQYFHGHAGLTSCMDGMIFAIIAVVLLGMSNSHRRTQALLQLYKNLRVESHKQ